VMYFSEQKVQERRKYPLGFFIHGIPGFIFYSFLFLKAIIMTWQHGDWMGFQVCITSVFFCCVYVNGTFKEKECFYVLQYFCGRHFITVSWKLGSFTSHQHIVFSFLSSSSLEPCGSECGVNATKES